MLGRLLAAHGPRVCTAALATATATIAAQNANRSSSKRAPLDPEMDPMCVALEKLYAGLDNGDEIPFSEHKAIDDSGGEQAYGELTVRGTRELRPLLEPVPGDIFYDLGSGTGRCVVQAAVEWPIERAVGIELSASRHGAGEMALARADPSLQRRVRLREGDMIACEGVRCMPSRARDHLLSLSGFVHVHAGS